MRRATRKPSTRNCRGLSEFGRIAIIKEFRAQNVSLVPPKLSRTQSAHLGQVAQLVERSPEKAGVGGSIPSLATICLSPPESAALGVSAGKRSGARAKREGRSPSRKSPQP